MDPGPRGPGASWEDTLLLTWLGQSCWCIDCICCRVCLSMRDLRGRNDRDPKSLSLTWSHSALRRQTVRRQLTTQWWKSALTALCYPRQFLICWLRSSVVRTLVSDRRTFPGLRSICSGCVTTYMGITSAIGQPTRPTQPFILPGSINERRVGIRCLSFRWRHLANVRKVETGMV